MIAAVYVLVGAVVCAAGIVLIGRYRRRYLGSLTLFVGLNLILLGYAFWQGLDNDAMEPTRPAATAAAPSPGGG